MTIEELDKIKAWCKQPTSNFTFLIGSAFVAASNMHLCNDTKALTHQADAILTEMIDWAKREKLF